MNPKQEILINLTELGVTSRNLEMVSGELDKMIDDYILTNPQKTVRAIYWASNELIKEAGEYAFLCKINPCGLEMLKFVKTDVNTEPNEYNRHIIEQCIETNQVHYEIFFRDKQTDVNL